jgi:hypothetical protein
MTTIHKIAEYALESLSKINESANGINYSFGEFGNSAYIYTNGGFFAQPLKIRISDHSVEGSRLLSEVHVNSIEQVDAWILSIEKKYFKERFLIENYQTTVNGKPCIAKKYTRI